jgi:hypothetical protein
MGRAKRLLLGLGAATGLMMAMWYLGRVDQQRDAVSQRDFDTLLWDGVMRLEQDDPQAADLLLQALRVGAPDPARQAVAEVQLGIAQLWTDPVNATSILKRVSANERYPAHFRAGAILFALASYRHTGDQQFARTHLFSGEGQWRALLADGDLDGAVRRAYEWASSLSPTAEASYQLALWHGTRLLEHEADPGRRVRSEEQAADERLMRSHAEEGERLLARAVERGTLHASYVQEALVYQLRGMVYDIRHQLERSPELKRVAEESFESALQRLASPRIASLDSGKRISSYVRYHYAVMLARLTEERLEDRRQDVRALLSPLLEDTDRGAPFFAYLRNVAAGQDHEQQVARRRRLAQLARVDPRVGVLLERLKEEAHGAEGG